MINDNNEILFLDKHFPNLLPYQRELVLHLIQGNLSVNSNRKRYTEEALKHSVNKLIENDFQIENHISFPDDEKGLIKKLEYMSLGYLHEPDDGDIKRMSVTQIKRLMRFHKKENKYESRCRYKELKQELRQRKSNY